VRVLFVAHPAVGHVYPMVPLAWALRAAGHEVLIATAGDGLAVANAGLAVVDLLPGFDRRAMLTRMRREQPELVEQRLHVRIDDLHQEAPRFARMSARLGEAALPIAESWRPDLVVQSQLQGAGLLLASTLDVPLVTHGFGLARTGDLAGLLWQYMADVADRHGLTAPPERHVQLDVAPPSMVPGPPLGWPMRYVPYNGGGVLPGWLQAPADRPRIAVTLGTVAPGTVGTAPLGRILELADHVDAEFILALGSGEEDQWGTLPDSVRAAGWLPLTQLLPGCAAVVHHGGAGTTLTALACGTPQAIAPSGGDRYINAAAVHRRGAGLSIEPAELTTDLLLRLLKPGDIGRAAREVSEEMAGLPGPADIAVQLQQLVTEGPIA
jgi:UDP:flavonoid glycosyltransferase YjiC (YdhE family)